MQDVVATLGKSYAWETKGVKGAIDEVQKLEASVSAKMGKGWVDILKLAEASKGAEGYKRRKRSLVLLYSHFLRLEITNEVLKSGT